MQRLRSISFKYLEEPRGRAILGDDIFASSLSLESLVIEGDEVTISENGTSS